MADDLHRLLHVCKVLPNKVNCLLGLFKIGIKMFFVKFLKYF